MIKKNILITGSSGFIGRQMCEHFAPIYRVIAFGKTKIPIKKGKKYIQITGDVCNKKQISEICREYRPDIIIHCAGIAHQKISSSPDAEIYETVNHKATKEMADIAAKENPDIHFIYLSSVSVYGENHNFQKLIEEDICFPTTPYAISKLNAERSLKKKFDTNFLKQVDILRLAPVYDCEWSLNLEKRVFGPKKICYLRFGSGNQKMSVLARSNLIDFIEFRLKQRNDRFFCNIYNVCDKIPCSFNQIIDIFRQSKYQPNRWILKIPLGIVWVGTQILGRIVRCKMTWIYSCYDKLAKNLIFDNGKMLATGFNPAHSLETIFKK